MITIQIPAALRTFTERKREVEVEGTTVGDAVKVLADRFPDLKPHLYDNEDKLRSFINIFLGETNIRKLSGLETPIKDGDVIMLVPAIAGGM
jgi:adenylyltransferase/sulfurtransferase